MTSLQPVLLLLLLFCVPAAAGTLSVEVLDVGQGDSILIRTPGQKIILIDAGDEPDETLHLLQSRAVDHIDLMVATHPHADHIGGMQSVVEKIPTKLFVDNGLPHTTKTYANLMSTVEKKGIQYRTAIVGQTYRLDDGATLEVLFPTGRPLRNTRSDLNSNSVVVRLRHQGNCFLFTGDAEEPTESELLKSGLSQCDVLKVAHHGSNHSSTTRFLSVVRPKIALISAGASNNYGHPGRDTLANLHAIGAKIYRTDESGSVTLQSSEKGLEVTTKPTSPGSFQAPRTTRQLTTTGTAQGPATHVHACKYVASSSSKVFHEPGCRYAQRIKASNRQCFSDKTSAVKQGKRPAGCCKPQ